MEADEKTVGEQTGQDRLAHTRWVGHGDQICVQILVIKSGMKVKEIQEMWLKFCYVTKRSQPLLKAIVRRPIRYKEPQALNPQIGVCF